MKIGINLIEIYKIENQIFLCLFEIATRFNSRYLFYITIDYRIKYFKIKLLYFFSVTIFENIITLTLFNKCIHKHIRTKEQS